MPSLKGTSNLLFGLTPLLMPFSLSWMRFDEETGQEEADVRASTERIVAWDAVAAEASHALCYSDRLSLLLLDHCCTCHRKLHILPRLCPLFNASRLCLSPRAVKVEAK